MLFNLVKDLFNKIDVLRRSVTLWVQPKSERNFYLGGIRKKNLTHCQIPCSKTLYILFQHKLLFKLVMELFKKIEGLGSNVSFQVQSESEKFFDLIF